ncbi:vancomycin resistance histidine kinase VanS [Enterococcus asini]|uniref:vancomycin resistance histidine kinase VanS n=1 Tax=Enterococcus asini TaxID=57732 RepID=UPI000E53EE9E|nr:vancomycin resistance histidine kinase VanS [Enterococcus asini]RGW13691.1 vancomycin resistance histidine kinase VanS [Enterococcus asini]
MKHSLILSRKLIKQYILAALLAVGITLLVPFALKFLLGSRAWYYDDFGYPFLAWANQHLTILVVVTALICWLALTFYFIAKATRYLDQAFSATKQLITTPEKTIYLSKDLAEFEVEINQIREDSLFHQRAASEAEQRKNELIVYLAHDLRTPLTSIIGYLTLLIEQPELDMATRSKYTQITLEKAQRLESLINEFFEITRFNLTTITLEKRLVDLSLMIEQLSYEFLPVMAPKELTWQLELASNIQLEVDVEKFERVLDNLIKNAINYADPKTALSLELKEDHQQVQLTLTNHGATIPQNRLERIFEPFYRGDSARNSQTGGTGLGLPIAKEIIEHHGGTLHAESQNGTFQMILTLPKT